MNSIRVENPKRSVFDLTHDVKLSCNMGFLIPTMVMDCVPGDKVDLATEALIRFAPLVSPMFHRINVTFHSWAVPYRILWKNWSDYITETKQAGVLPAFPFTYASSDPAAYTELMDYLGIPRPDVATAVSNEKISAMRFAAYQRICNEFYRDENLTLVPTGTDLSLLDGDNSLNPNWLKIRKRCWGYDYFTSNLPFAQKGDPVTLPLAGTAQVFQNDIPGFPGEQSQSPADWVTFPGGVPVGKPQVEVKEKTGIPAEALYTELAGNVVTNINDLRLAEQLQKYLERAARAGTRLVEWIKGMFGVTLPDYTAQRPQYIGGTKSPVQISEVLNTTGTVGELPQGNMAGRGISVSNGNMGTYVAREHCVIMTIMSIMPETAYQQGLEKEWLKFNDPKEFLNPLFAHLGEQETKNRELAAYLDPAGYGDHTFGYLPRYAEYRTLPNRVAGDFRTTLNYWHMGRIFDLTAPPHLNSDFVESNPTHRVFADTTPTDQKMYVHCLNRIRAVRPLPKYGTPAL